MGILLLAVGTTFVIGLTALIPQAFGAGRLGLCSVYMNRMMIVTFGIFCVMQIPIQLSEYIFLAMGQSENVAYLSSVYCRIASLGVLFFYWGACYGCYSSGMNKPRY